MGVQVVLSIISKFMQIPFQVHDRQIQGLQRVNSPQKSPWFRRVLALCSDTEGLYPIHLAAKLGKPQLVKLLLQEGAEKETETSKGRVEEARNMFHAVSCRIL